MAKSAVSAKAHQSAIDDTINPFRAQHLSLARRTIATPKGAADVAFDEAESPLGWLARRKGRDGQPLIRAVQFQAGSACAPISRARNSPRASRRVGIHRELEVGAGK